MIDSFIGMVARNHSFLDVGSLWGNQRLTLAHQHGANHLATIDITPKDDPLWAKLVGELGNLADQTEFICGDVCNLEKNYDVICCSGVLYHHPNHVSLVQKLHEICNYFVILSTTYTESVVENSLGRIEIVPGGALFLPAVPEEYMKVLREDWREFLAGRPGDALEFSNTAWDFHNLQHWWWLFTSEYVGRLCQLIGFEIHAWHTENKILNLLLKKV